MRPLTVLLTASGVPGSAALIRALRENGERDIRLVGTDMSDLAIGRHLCDAFYITPPGADPGFADALVEICKNEQVDAVLPQSSFELQALAENKGCFGETAVLVAGPEAVRRSNDKAETYALLDEIGVRGPAWRRTRSSGEVESAARERSELEHLAPPGGALRKAQVLVRLGMGGMRVEDDQPRVDALPPQGLHVRPADTREVDRAVDDSQASHSTWSK